MGPRVRRAFEVAAGVAAMIAVGGVVALTIGASVWDDVVRPWLNATREEALPVIAAGAVVVAVLALWGWAGVTPAD